MEPLHHFDATLPDHYGKLFPALSEHLFRLHTLVENIIEGILFLLFCRTRC